MSLTVVSELPALSAELQRFMVENAGSLPAHTREALIASAGHPSPVDRIVKCAEALYAIKSELSKEGRDLAANLAQAAASNGWHGMSERGVAMSQALQRIGGYAAPAGMEWPSAEDDPEPLDAYLEPEEPAAPPAT